MTTALTVAAAAVVMGLVAVVIGRRLKKVSDLYPVVASPTRPIDRRQHILDHPTTKAIDALMNPGESPSANADYYVGQVIWMAKEMGRDTTWVHGAETVLELHFKLASLGFDVVQITQATHAAVTWHTDLVAEGRL